MEKKTADNTIAKLIHVFVNGRSTVAMSRSFQICSHTAVAVFSIMAVVNVADLLLNLRFLGIIICLPVFSVVIVSIRPELQPPQEPANAEFLLMIVHKSISL